MAADSMEFDILTSHAGIGFPKDLIIPLNAFAEADTGLALTAATTPRALALTTTAINVIQWAAAAAASVQAAVQIPMPFDYAYNPVYPGRDAATVNTAAINSDSLKFYGMFRRQIDGTTPTSDTGTLTPQVTVMWWTPTTSVLASATTLTTAAAGEQASATTGLTNGTASMVGISADNRATLTGFYPMVFDVGARLRAEGKRILPGDMVQVLVGPATASNAGVAIQMSAFWMRYRANACFNDMRMRGINLA